MFKKFFKKIGKGIKKLGKAVGKPFKKLFKSKIGKVLGTIGLMLVAPWMAQTVGSWFSGALGTAGTAAGGTVSAGAAGSAASTAAASGTAAAGSSAASSAAASKTFGNAIGDFFRSVGSKVKSTYNTITDGIKNIFTQGGGVDKVAADAANAGSKAVTEAGASSIDFVSDSVVSGGKAPKIIETEIAKIKPPVDTSTVVTDAVGETSVVKVKPKVSDSLLDKSVLELDKASMQDTLRQDVMADLTEQANTGPLKRIGSNVKDFLQGDTKYADLKKQTLDIQPLKNVEALPGFVKKATVGEGVLLGQTITANRMPEPYQAPSVDVSGAFAALSEVDTSGTGIDMIGSNVPNTMAMAQGGMDTTKWMNMTKKHNYIYDASQWG